jgi:hypothetical protein
MPLPEFGVLSPTNRKEKDIDAVKKAAARIRIAAALLNGTDEIGQEEVIRGINVGISIGYAAHAKD